MTPIIHSNSPLGPIENDSITDKFDHKSELNEDGLLRRSCQKQNKLAHKFVDL